MDMIHLNRLLISLIIILSSVSFTDAQVQYGVVKTPGRPGKHGTGLKGAVVKVSGRNDILVENSNGSFSFPLASKQFAVKSVELKNYKLIDSEAAPKTYRYSSTPIVFLMETADHLLADQLAAERSIRQSLQRTINEREKELEKLRQQNKITQEQLQKAMLELYDYEASNEKLIRDMAIRFTQMDFDQLDSINRKISQWILEGELTKADSLLRTKGDIHVRIAQLNQHHEANIKDREQLEQSESLEQYNREDVANDCYSKFDMFKLKLQFDSAAHYIALRADLKPPQAQWLNDAGIFYRDYLSKFQEAEKFFQRSIDALLSEETTDELMLAETYDELGQTYYIGSYYDESIDSEKAIELSEKALSIRERLLGEKHALTAEAYNNLGILTDHSLITKAINILKELDEENNPSLATYYENFAITRLLPSGYWQQAMEQYLLPALAIKKKAYGDESISTAEAFTNIGKLYQRQSYYPMSHWWVDCACAISYFSNALRIYEKTYGKEHLTVAELHRLIGQEFKHLAENHKNSGSVALADGCLEVAINELNATLDIYNNYESKHGFLPAQSTDTQELFEEVQSMHQASINDNEHGLENITLCYKVLAGSLYDCGQYENSLAYLLDALKSKSSWSYEPGQYKLAADYLDIGKVYYTMGDTTHAQEWFDKALATDILGLAYDELSNLYDSQNELEKAALYCKKMIETDQSNNNPRDVLYERMGNICERSGDYHQAAEWWKRALDLREKEYYSNRNKNSTLFLFNPAEVYEEVLALEYRDLIESYNKSGYLYAMAGDKTHSQECYNKVLDMMTDSLGNKHHLIADCYDNIGMMHCLLGEYTEAEKVLKKAQKIRKKADFDDETDRTLALTQSDICMGKLYACQNDSTKALELFREAYQTRSQYYSVKRSPEIAECWLCVGKLYEQFGEYEKALTCYDEVYRIKAYSINHVYKNGSIVYSHPIDYLSETAITPDPEILYLERHIKELEDKCYPDDN